MSFAVLHCFQYETEVSFLDGLDSFGRHSTPSPSTLRLKSVAPAKTINLTACRTLNGEYFSARIIFGHSYFLTYWVLQDNYNFFLSPFFSKKTAK